MITSREAIDIGNVVDEIRRGDYGLALNISTLIYTIDDVAFSIAKENDHIIMRLVKKSD